VYPQSHITEQLIIENNERNGSFKRMVISAVFQASKYTSQCLRWQLGAEKTLQLLSGFQVHIMFEKTQLLSFVKKKTCLSEIFFFACLTPSLRKQNLSFYF